MLPRNGGMAADAICTGIGAKDLDAITAFAQENAHRLCRGGA